MKNTFLTRLILCLTLMLTACAPATGRSPEISPSPTAGQGAVEEIPIQPIPLTGLASLANAEFSGLAWYGEWLVLLPQYPSRFPGGGEGALLALSRQDLLDVIDGKSDKALSPRSIPLIAPDLSKQVRGYEGFEALAIIGDRVYLTIETNTGSGMLTYLVSGTIAPDLSAIKLNTAFLRPIPAQAEISNFSDEAILAGQERIFTLYEANGALFNPQPVAHQFDLNLTSPETVAFPNIEYRITDATAMDAQGMFWAINYFFPGDTKIAPVSDPIAHQFGQGYTHAHFPQVERLVQFQFKDNSFRLVDRAPVQLELVGESTARNWEGIAILDGRGFLLVTDQYPSTLLAFVPYPTR